MNFISQTNRVEKLTHKKLEIYKRANLYNTNINYLHEASELRNSHGVNQHYSYG